jgi:hypothetical protein
MGFRVSPPQPLKPFWICRRVNDGVPNILVPKIVLNEPRVCPTGWPGRSPKEELVSVNSLGLVNTSNSLCHEKRQGTKEKYMELSQGKPGPLELR